MEQQTQTPTTPTPPPNPNPTEPPPPTQPQSSQPQPSSLPSSTPTIPSTPNPNPNPKPLTPLPPNNNNAAAATTTTTPQPPRPSFTRPPWPSSSSSSSNVQRGGMAIGVPAATSHHTNPVVPPPQSTPYSSSFGQQQFGRPVSNTSSTTGQVRQPTPGYQSVGTMGQMRPGGISVHQQQRPGQPSLRPESVRSSQTSTTQSFQGHGLLRGPSVGSLGLPSPNTSQSTQIHNQPWLSSGSQGRPVASPQFRPPVNSPSLQQRSHIPQQQHSLPTTSQQQSVSSAQQSQSSLSHQQSEQHRQQFPPSRIPQSISHQLQMQRGMGSQKPSSLAITQPSTIHSGAQNITATADIGESCNRILSKRSIHELVSQIDPSEKLDPEVEDILIDIADEFVESITTFGCSLAKHRKSTTLEAKDILLHLERNWNMTLPGFGGDEIKCFRKPIANEIHRERLAAIKKSLLGNETNTKLSSGQAPGSAKTLAKAPVNAMDSQN